MPTVRVPPAPPMRAAIVAPRERTRALLRRALPRRRWRLTSVRDPAQLRAALHRTAVDAVLVDLAGASSVWQAAALARDYLMLAFVGIAPFRCSDADAVARCAELGFADVLAEGVDDELLGAALGRDAFTARFVRALADPPAPLGLAEPMQRQAWRAMLESGGRPVTTDAIAHRCGVTREHLSRTFSGDGSPSLKESIDLVRLLAAAAVSKNPGYDLADVARVLGYASAAQLGRLCRRLLGRASSSLPRLRGEDLIAIWSSTR